MPRPAKDVAIALLVVVNAVLVCAVLSGVIALPRASAQTPAQPGQPATAGQAPGQFLAVSGQVQTGLDAQYIIDVAQQRLYVYSPTHQGAESVMQLTDMRDLRADFAKQPTPAIPPRGR